MRTSVCVSFMLRPSYFLSDLHRGLRASCETFAEKPNGAPSSLSVIKKKHRHSPSAIDVRADEKRTAFVELERAIHEFAVSLIA